MPFRKLLLLAGLGRCRFAADRLRIYFEDPQLRLLWRRSLFHDGFRLRCNRVNRRPRGDRFHFNSRGFGMIGRSDLLNDIFGLLGDLGFTIAMGR